ncbi:MAG TPA: electron transfer flavoprotein subunit beta/FixA family protein [Candidatus Dormibacteraeota bacterium]|jgi:electron transfer flavoprotein beta subunit
MNVVVCVKQVPDPNSPGRLDPSTRSLKRDGELVLDPGDEFGVEAGLQLAEKHGGEVTVVSMGPQRVVDAVRKALAMGAAKGVLITDDSLAGSDALTTAKVLAAAIRKMDFDVVITATESTDGYTGVVPQILAGLLDIPAVTFAKSVSYEGDILTVERQTETGVEVVEATLPVVISVTAGVNEPRYPSLKGIMGAKQKPLDRPTLTDLGIEGVGGASAGQKVTAVDAAPLRAAGEIIQGDGEAAKRIVDFLIERKVI